MANDNVVFFDCYATVYIGYLLGFLEDVAEYLLEEIIRKSDIAITGGSEYLSAYTGDLMKKLLKEHDD